MCNLATFSYQKCVILATMYSWLPTPWLWAILAESFGRFNRFRVFLNLFTDIFFLFMVVSEILLIFAVGRSDDA